MANKKKILVVEDEKNIAQVLAYNIKKEGYVLTGKIIIDITTNY